MAATVLFVLSSLIMATTVQAQDCPKPEGIPNISLRDEDIVKKTFPDEQRIRLRCGIGYTSAGGSPYITCLAGSWSPVQLKCERKNCGSAGEVANARINYEGTEFGDKAEIRCNKGYTMVGKGDLNCGDNGWMGRLPVCEGKKCFSPPVIANGYLRPDREAYEYRDVVTYSCDDDYTLEGQREGMCSENGDFSPNPPICKPKDCSRPGGGSNMHLKGNDNRKYTFPHDSTVTFECNEGFNDEGGSPLSNCTAGRWSPVELRCEIKDCGLPKNVTNGRINYKWTEYDDKAKIRCDHGYKLIGNSEITCKMMGWSEPPTCQVVTCVSPPEVANGSFTPVKDVYRYEDSVDYSCDDGYKLLGLKRLKCINNDTFLPDPPQCKPKDCSRPGGGSNMHLKGNDNRKYTFPHNSTVTFECNDGFIDEGGSPLSICTAGRWSPVELRCEIKNCGPPNNVTNGKINYKWTEYDDKATIRCDHGYKLIGNSEVTCKMMGWSEPPTCQVVTCVSPPVVANGSFTPDKDVYRYEDSVVYSCNDGYKLLGLKRLKCKNNDTFLPDPPQCELVTCDSPPMVENGNFSPNSSSYNYGDNVTYTCESGYAFNGTSELTCSDEGEFNPEPPQSVRVECKDPKIPNAEIVNGSQLPHGPMASVTYKCKDGYEMSTSLTCDINNQWSPGIPQCIKKKSCGCAGSVENGDINYEGTEFGDKTTVICQKGYRMIGNPVLVCGDQGWMGRLPTCKGVECKDPEIPNAEIVNGSQPPHGHKASVTYKCKDGYVMSTTLTCDINSQWSPGIPQCIKTEQEDPEIQNPSST